jgi:RecA-family ATPase
MGKITALDGHPGQGKSTLTMALAACASNGHPLPGQGVRNPTGVIILSAEDEAEDTIVPRLMAHDADLSRIYILDAVAPKGQERKHLWRLPDDIGILESAIRECGAGLVVIDPLMAYLGSQHDSYRDQDVRMALHPLADMAKRTRAAVLLVRHLTKGGSGPALMRGSGSIGIIGAARAGLLVAPDPDDPEEQNRVVAVTKMNLGKRGASWEFRLVSTDLGCARVQWVRSSGHTAETLLVEHKD